MNRIGLGVDVHAFDPDPERRLVLGGVEIPGHPGLAGHSDADAVTHAVCDALLGAAALGDIGTHFPDTDPEFRDADSIGLLSLTRGLLAEAGFSVSNIDVTVLAETPRIAPHREAMRKRLAQALDIDPGQVGIKATTTERLGLVGRGEGIAALATALVASSEGRT